jgi:aminoglycoside phosphotransferase (APT) family kinase protein
MAAPSAPSSVTDGLRATLEPVLGPVDVEDLHRLSGGASRETWSFRAGGRELILRRDPPGRPSPRNGMHLEAEVMRACTMAGLRVAEVVVDDDGSTLGTAGLVMARVEGESLPKRILSDDRFASARGVLVAQAGEFMAGLHAIDPTSVPGLPQSDVLTDMWAVYEAVDFPSPTFERAQEWLVANRPVATESVIVHGDLRLGNLLVDEVGLAAVIDWELVHQGDPLEDLAWICVKAWRFGHAPEVAGLGPIEELVDAYERASGRTVDRDALHWWLVQKTLQWGLICIGQAWAHLSGAVRSHELAAVGRRVAEQEWDLIRSRRVRAADVP